jgi:all-trans-8'-apo-beta-carotenal 15,15'-oxygenase
MSERLSPFGPLLLSPVEDASYEVTNIEGTLPPCVRGTYYLNGPARFENGGQRYNHWLDGDGMVCALHFSGGRVRFTNRFVRTRKFLAEQEAGGPVFRTFGTRFPGDRLHRGLATESPANVSVYPYRHRLLAFGENALPYELDPVTLQTCGPFNFDNQLGDLSPFAAHPKLARDTGEWFNFGLSYAAAEPSLTLYRFDAHGVLAYRKRVPLPYPCTVHDFTLSPTYAVFHLSPYLLDVKALLRHGLTTTEALRWAPERGSRLLILARESSETAAHLPVGRGYCLHLINSFEEDDRLCIDLVEYERPLYDQYQPLPDLFRDLPRGEPVRFVVSMDRREIIERVPLGGDPPDFPSLDPRDDGQPYDSFWMLAIASGSRGEPKFFDRLARASWRGLGPVDVYRPPAGQYLGGEPVFVGDPERRGCGAVICQVHHRNPRETAFAVFDAFDLAAGPVARIPLRSPLPPGFHASFIASLPDADPTTSPRTPAEGH